MSYVGKSNISPGQKGPQASVIYGCAGMYLKNQMSYRRLEKQVLILSLANFTSHNCWKLNPIGIGVWWIIDALSILITVLPRAVLICLLNLDHWCFCTDSMPRASCQIRKIAGCACTENTGNDPDMPHGGFLWSRWRWKRSRHSRHMRNPQFYVSGKRPIHVECMQCDDFADITNTSTINGRVHNWWITLYAQYNATNIGIPMSCTAVRSVLMQIELPTTPKQRRYNEVICPPNPYPYDPSLSKTWLLSAI